MQVWLDDWRVLGADQAGRADIQGDARSLGGGHTSWFEDADQLKNKSDARDRATHRMIPARSHH
jgi:hypothetical protein